MHDMAAKGRSPRGSANPKSKLTEQDIPIIRRRLAEGEAMTALGRQFGVSDVAILYVRQGRTWRHIP